MVEKYNSTYHRSIKLEPTDARKPAGYKHVHNPLYAKVTTRKATSPRFHVGDKVRIVRKKVTFEKGFIPNWTEEVFTITTVKDTKPTTYYRGSSWRVGSGILLRAGTADECAGNLLNRTSQRGKYRVFVKWKGYGIAFNSWVPVADVEQL